MALSYPLYINKTDPTNGIISELPVGDSLDFTNSGIIGLSTANLQLLGGTTGQVLQTDGAGNLSWVAPTTEVVASSWLLGNLTGNVIASPEGNIIGWNTTSIDIAWNNATGNATLIAGRRYLLYANIVITSTTTLQTAVTWWNNTTNTSCGIPQCRIASGLTNTYSNNVSMGIFTPTVNTLVGLRITATNTGISYQSNETHFSIVRLA